MSLLSVSLTAATTANLLSLNQTAGTMGTIEDDLSTGKSVNSALDNATAYFASQGFLNTASDLGNIQDGLSTSLQTVTAASNAISSITTLVNQMQGIATSALQSSDTAVRANYASQFNALMVQIDELVNDATFNGTNLLTSGASLQVNFNSESTSALTIAGIGTSVSDLGISKASGGWATTAEINTSSLALESALNTLTANSASFGDNAIVIETRQSFTSSLIDVLQQASDNLVLADTNVEGAELTSLQTTQQLGIDSLSISSSSQQAILRLFG